MVRGYGMKFPNSVYICTCDYFRNLKDYFIVLTSLICKMDCAMNFTSLENLFTRVRCCLHSPAILRMPHLCEAI